MPDLPEVYPQSTPASTPCYVYTLNDPDTGEIRYVGKTIKPQIRLRQHCSSFANQPHSYKWHWIKSLLDRGLKPVMVIVETCATNEQANASEKRLIAEYRAAGCCLTNRTDGGEL